jgi:hypothetical protein
MTFLTLEDVNSLIASYYNVPFWDKTTIETTSNISDKHYNYLKVSRLKSGNNYTFTIKVENSIRTGHYYILDDNGAWLTGSMNNNVITVTSTTPTIHFYTHLYIQSTTQTSYNGMKWIVKNVTPALAKGTSTIDVVVDLEAVDTSFTINGKSFTINNGASTKSVTASNNQLSFQLAYNDGYNFTITYSGISLPVHIRTIKDTNIVDLPNNLTLYNGNINTFTLVTDSENLEVNCDYPVTITDDEVTIDLTNKADYKKVNLTVNTLSDEDYYPSSQTFLIGCDYSELNTITDLTKLFTNGGIAKIGTDLTLNSDMIISKPVYLIGQEHTINLDGHNILVQADTNFKAENLNFENGLNTIIQEETSTVELNKCSFTDCTSINGYGSCIYCDIDLNSLDNPTDYETIIKNTTFTNNDSCILQGGELTIDKCNVDGKINVPSSPYFLYQTDGTANITNTMFNISDDEPITTDIQFNSCIFIIGETAIINNGTSEDYSKNNVTDFLNNNHSAVDLTYYYDLIEDYITLSSTNGFCHGVSGQDFIFKTNIQLEREE